MLILLYSVLVLRVVSPINYCIDDGRLPFNSPCIIQHHNLKSDRNLTNPKFSKGVAREIQPLETPEQFFNKTEDISKLLCNCHLPHPRLYSYIKCILGIHREFSAVPIEYQSLRVYGKIAITDNVQLRKWLPIPTQTEKITMQLDEQVACGRFPSAAFNIQLRVVAKLQFKHLIWGP